MNYRRATEADLPFVQQMLEHFGGTMADPRMAMFIIAEQDGELHGVLTCQLVMHFEPLIASQPMLIRGLVETAETEYKKLGGVAYYTHCPNDTLGGIAEVFGMQAMDGKLYQKILVDSPAQTV